MALKEWKSDSINDLDADPLIDEHAGDYVGDMPVDEELAALQMLEDEIARQRHGQCLVKCVCANTVTIRA